MRIAQLLHVGTDDGHEIVWGLDPNGEIWECRRGWSSVKAQPLAWTRLEFGESQVMLTREMERVTGAEQFRAAVLQHLRIFQNTAKGSERMAICDLISEIEKLDILEALGLK